MSTSTYRLPNHVSPRRYDIKLDARLGREDFFGSLTIQLEIHEEKDTIDLHAKDLTVGQANIMIDGQPHKANITPDPENERVVLQFSQPFPVGEAMLELEFNGKVSQSLTGLYLAQDRPEQMLCTQCEATDARAIFPCFDEPTFKAQFAFEITTTPDVTVLANGPLLSVEENDSGKTWKFAPTKIMSSYLVAFAIGDIASTPEQVVNGIPLRVWAMQGKERLGTFAQEYTARLLTWYEEYFGVPYHFDKYDQIAVPGFAAGAMENSGLVLFRQHLLLMEPESTSWMQEKAIARVIAHEFAHMWFGNFVTMQWWDDIWLNEAFAEWMAYRVVAALSPEYKIWDDFEGIIQTYAFSADALESTHPIYSKVETPAQAMELFDNITYIKGCGVMRMLENFLSPEVFRNGLRTYMQEFGEHNARGSDLWRNLQAASDQPVTTIIESWILQGGHPFVTVALETANGGEQLQVSQKRFFSNPNAPQDNDQSWQVPLIIRYADDTGIHDIRHLLTGESDTVALQVEGELRWCHVNADQVGFYRQNLTGTLLDKILNHLDQLTSREQMGLLADQLALTRSGVQSITQFLKVLKAMASQANSYNLIVQVVEHLHTLERMVEDIGNPSIVENFRKWVRELFKERLDTLGFVPVPDETDEVAQQRRSVIHTMASLGHDQETVAQVRTWAEREAEDPQSVNSNLAATFVSINAQFGDGGVFKNYVNIYQKRKASGAPPQTVNRYLQSLAEFRDPELISQMLSLLDEGVIPSEATIPGLAQMLRERHSQLVAWEYIKNNWEKINKIGMGGSPLIKVAGNLPYSMRSDFVEFCDAHVKGVSDMSYAQGLEIMDQLAEFQARTKDDLVEWLNNV